MKITALLFLCFLHVHLIAQTDTLFVQIDGMTCSLCSRSVEDQLMKQSFVKKVIPQLNSQEMTVVVTIDSIFSFEKIGKSIIDAGFSVGKIRFKSCMNTHPLCLMNFNILDTNSMNTTYFVLIRKGLVSKKIYEKYAPLISNTGAYTVVYE
jgi:copper chaperone CopZ